MPIPAALPITPSIPSGLTAEWPSVSITGGDGFFWDLSNPEAHIQLQPGWTGFDLPPSSTYVDGTPGLPGGSYQGSHDDVRPLFVPVYATGDNRAQGVAYRRSFLRSIHPSQGPVTITVAETDGTHRSITAVYAGGGEGIEGDGTSGLDWAVYGLNFTAIDQAYWVGDPEPAGPWSIGAPVAFFTLAPYMFRLSGSQVLGLTAIHNRGDVEAFPIWTLKGPATQLTLQLGARVFVMTPTLLAGHTITINTDPASQTITDETGANRWADVDTTSYDLWSLPPGDSTATVSVTSGTSATELSMVYTPRYLTK